MTNLERIDALLAKAGVFFLNTIDGERPRSRPLGFRMMVKGRLYFAVGQHKSCYRELTAHPQVEIVACKGVDWLRYDGTAVVDDDPALFTKACEVMPMLAKLYGGATGHTLGIFYLKDAVVEFGNLMGVTEKAQL